MLKHEKELLFAPDTVTKEKELAEDAWEPADDDHDGVNVGVPRDENDPWARKNTHNSMRIFSLRQPTHHTKCLRVHMVITTCV